MQLKQIAFQIKFKLLHILFLAFATFKFLPSKEQIIETNYFFKNMTINDAPPMEFPCRFCIK